MALDTELLGKVNSLADRWLEFEKWKMKQPGLEEMRGFHVQEIEEDCAKKDLAPRPYVEMYVNMITNNLENRCIRRTFPVVEDECKKLCKGYDKSCDNHIPTSRYDLSEIQDIMDYKEEIQKYPLQKQ